MVVCEGALAALAYAHRIDAPHPANAERNGARPRRASAAPISRRAIARRLDALALEQLRAEAARLAVENERLQQLLQTAEQQAEFWWDQATTLTEQMHAAGARVGINRDGELSVVEGPQS